MTGFLIEAKIKGRKDRKYYLIKRGTSPNGELQNFHGWYSHVDYESSYTEDYAHELLYTKKIFDYDKYVDFMVVEIIKDFRHM